MHTKRYIVIDCHKPSRFREVYTLQRYKMKYMFTLQRMKRVGIVAWIEDRYKDV